MSPAAVATTAAAGRRCWSGIVPLVGLCVVALVAARPVVAQGARSAGGGGVIYVDADAPPGGDGASWASAFRDLQDALAAATVGDELWVAEGVYKPTEGSDRTATFALASGVALYGGFDGTETQREERDWTLHRSILSGDVGVPSDSLDNAYHVVTASGVDATAVLDGLTIRHGMGRGGDLPHDRGAGVLAIDGSPTIRNARFFANAIGPPVGGLKPGGGMYVEDGSPVIEDTRFEYNGGGGGGLYASGGSPVLRRVVFRRNVTGAIRFADGSAGLVEDALFEENTGPAARIDASSPVFRRTTFRDNVTTLSGTEGAGAYVNGGAPRFEDCLFERLRTQDDLGGGGGGGVHVRSSLAPASPAFLRSTFRDNTANQGGGAFLRDPATRALFLTCRFEHNRALAGGGLYAKDVAVTVAASTFVGNRAEPAGSGCCGTGGGLAVDGPWAGERAVVASALFAGNTARAGAAVAVAGPGTALVDLVNVAAAGNAASETGGAVHVLNAAGLRLRNVVLWGNGAPTGSELYLAGGASPTIEQALIAGGCPTGATCTGVLDEDPLFVRAPSPGPDGTWGTEDDDYGSLRVHPSSPAVDGGLTALLPPDLWDLDGDGDTAEPLPIDAVGGRRVWGSEVDLGAYERGPAARSPWRAPPVAASSEVGGVQVEVRPNPVRGSGTVVLTLGEASEVEVSVYDVLGRRVAVLHEGPLGARRHALPLDAEGLPPGVYVVRVTVGGVVESARVTVGR